MSKKKKKLKSRGAAKITTPKKTALEKQECPWCGAMAFKNAKTCFYCRRELTPTSKKIRGHRRSKVTRELMEKFLEIVANNGGIVCDAAEDLNISRRALYRKRAADKKFAEAWDKAVDRGIDVIEDEAKRRALDGTEEPVFYKGEVCGYIRRKSDVCMSLVLKAHRSNYRQQSHELTGPGGSPLPSNVTIYLPDNERDKDAENNQV